MHFQMALSSEHVAGFGRIPFSELGWYSERMKKKIDRIAVKPKSADNYAGRPNNNDNKLIMTR